jgi:hypothetical protein
VHAAFHPEGSIAVASATRAVAAATAAAAHLGPRVQRKRPGNSRAEKTWKKRIEQVEYMKK